MMNQDNEGKEESVEELMKKLAKKGKKVKLIDETGSVKELPALENADAPAQGSDIEVDLDRDAADHVNDSLDEINEEMAAPSSVKKKFKKIKEERHDGGEILEQDEPNSGENSAP